jgi:RimJ/RimL family protein N-acetyltransferase
VIEGDRLPTLEARRVLLRWLDDGDVAALYAIFADPEVMRYWSAPPLGDVEDAGRLLDEIRRHFREKTLFQWGVARREDDRVVGTCTLDRPDPVNLRAEIGFALSREHQGRGYMGEALDALLDHAFGPLGLRRIEADVDPRNAASIRLLEKLGFRREGHLRQRWRVGDEVQDSLFYGLLRDERKTGGDPSAT